MTSKTKDRSDTIILFDLDGTLIDSTQAIVKSFRYAFNQNKFDIQVSDQDITKLIGYPLEYMFEKLGAPKNKIEIYIDSYKSLYRQINHDYTTLLPGALSSIQLARSFATLGIVTTKTTKYTTPMLKQFDILKYFDVIIGRQEVTNPKPHPEPILKAIADLQPKPNTSIYMIGDTILDMQSAYDAKVYGIGVLCGYGTYKELSKYSDTIVDDSMQAVLSIQNFKTSK